MTIEEKLKIIEEEKKHFEQCRQRLKEVSAPEKTDINDIPLYYDIYEKVYKKFYKNDDKKLFVFVIFLMYSPVSCIGRAEKSKVRGEIAKVLGISKSSVSVKLSDAQFYYKKIPSFCKSVKILYDILIEHPIIRVNAHILQFFSKTE